MRALVGLALAVAGLVVVGGPAQAAGFNGYVDDTGSSPAAGLLHVKGWIYDLDDGSAPVPLHLYVGGTWNDPNAQFIDLGLANEPRPDVPSSYPGAGPNTGFDRTVEVAKFGNQPIYLYALNAVGPEGDPVLLINGTSVQIDSPNPGGDFTSASSSAPGQVSVTGFAFEYSAPDKTRVVVTTNDAYAGTLVADQRGPGFEDFPVMFNGTVPSPGGDVRVCVTAIDQGVGSDQSLGCKQVQVVAPPVPPVPPVVTPPPAEQPRITLALKAGRKKSRLRIDVGPDLEQSNYQLKIQRKAGKKWRTVKRTQTLGPRDRIRIDLRRGKYRVIVPAQHGLQGVRATARLRR
ncbi:hypothetical protein [Nocardioides baculatus]|uniref:Fibronectin type III domain-containing protein n=1 Tax=Nocardioides baculatus TaxID=2801337 RepID=A0ABS1LE20_9ACTN|nr:hypothetical protein [Nocardioides baculatus]MBL0749924.1 hypothetical protein [Nocardioides baculatus]